MKIMRSLVTSKIPCLVLIFIIFPIKNVYAYLDPGSGSYIFQLLMAGLLGMLFVMKIFWKRIVYFLKRLFAKKGKNNG